MDPGVAGERPRDRGLRERPSWEGVLALWVFPIDCPTWVEPRDLCNYGYEPEDG